MARPGFEPTISRSEVNPAKHYSIGPLNALIENQQIYLSNILCDETKSESWPVRILVSVRIALVKLELTDLKNHYSQCFNKWKDEYVFTI